MTKSDQNSCSYTTDTIMSSTRVSQFNINKYINTDYQSDHIINSNMNSSINTAKENTKNGIDLESGNESVDFTITSCSRRSNYKRSNTGNSSNVNNDKWHVVQENKKLKEDSKRVFTLGDSIVKHFHF